MIDTATEQASPVAEQPPQRISLTRRSLREHGLATLAGLSTCLYAAIALLSWRFDVDSAPAERPILSVLLLFTFAFLIYLLSIRLVVKGPVRQASLTLIVWAAILFRVVMLFSVPIQEIDIYRYLWDGAVSSTGTSPVRYSPQQVLAAHASTPGDDELRRLIALLDREPALAEILRRVHFAELPTIYPSTSQAVFAAAHWITPSGSSVLVRVFIMKTCLVAFDIATVFVVIALLKLCEKPAEWCLSYAWCPLLMKEVANSGHLDAVAVFLTTLTVYLVTRLLVKRTEIWRAPFLATMDLVLVSFLFALAVGAKIYPIVLAPILFWVIAKNIGLRYTVPAVAAFALMSVIVLWPILPHDRGTGLDPSVGVKTFLRRWEMNDFIFMVLIEVRLPLSRDPCTGNPLHGPTLL